METNGVQPAHKPGKRLALFFDGTWNEPPDRTNVRRLRLMLAERCPEGIEQRAFYNAGVGTKWYDRLSGGLIGSGLSENVRDGYRWLVENYDEGDEIYLFGFESRRVQREKSRWDHRALWAAEGRFADLVRAVVRTVQAGRRRTADIRAHPRQGQQRQL